MCHATVAASFNVEMVAATLYSDTSAKSFYNNIRLQKGFLLISLAKFLAGKINTFNPLE
jgi:hypothetical protein